MRDASTLGRYSSKETRDKLKHFNIDDQVQPKGYRGQALSQDERERNTKIAVTRAGGERPFATYKRHYGLARTRFMGLATNATFYGLPDPNYILGWMLRCTYKFT